MYFPLSTLIVAFWSLLTTQVQATPPLAQEVLASDTMTKIPVPGRNSAYYTQVPPEGIILQYSVVALSSITQNLISLGATSDQLFDIRYLVAYPDKPACNEHMMVYLYGHIMSYLPSLEDATLNISGLCPEPYIIGDDKLTEWRTPVVRHGTEYGGPLTYGPNEILCDQLMLYWPPFEDGKWNCSVEVTARLPEPDRRVLFSFAQNFTLQWPKEDDRCVLDTGAADDVAQGNMSAWFLK